MFGKRKTGGEKPAAPGQDAGTSQPEPKLRESKPAATPARPAQPAAQPAGRAAPPIANPSVNNPIAGITAPSRGGNGHAGSAHGAGGGDHDTAKSATAKSTQGAGETPRRTQERREITPMTGESEGKKLIVGRDIRLAGEITTCDTLVVEGQVECNLTDSKMLDIAESGVFKGKASVEVAEISGLFEGELTVSKHLNLQGSGQIKGKLRYKEMEIARGGRISGDIAELEAAQSGAKAPAEARPQPAEPERSITPERDADAQPRAAAGGNAS